jgi:hypothetical protein
LDLHSLQPEDIVEVDRRGLKFLAVVKRVENGTVHLVPIDRGITYFRAPARQIVGIWHANKATRRRRQSKEEVVFADGS